MLNNKDKSSNELREKLTRYENMLRSGTKVYFDEGDLLDIAEYYYYDMSKDAEALRCLEYALKLHPESLPAKLRIAEVHYYMGQTAKAWKILNSLTEQDDPDVQYYYGLFSLEEGDTKKADSYYRKAYSLEQGNGIELFCSIVSDYLEHNSLDEIESWFNFLPNAYADDPRIIDSKAWYLRLAGHYEEAVKLIEKLIDIEPYNADHWMNLTKLYIDLGEIDKARESNAYVLDIAPDNHAAMCISADLEFHSGAFSRAHELYDKYISLEDKDAQAYFNNAFCLVSLNMPEEALQQLHYALKFADSGDTMLLMKIHFIRATVLICLNELKKAEEELKEARNYGLENENYLYNSAMILYKEGEKSKAMRILNELMHNNLEKGKFPRMVFFAYMALSDYNGMLKSLNKAGRFFRSAGTMPDFALKSSPYYAFAYYKTNERDGFLANLKIATENAPDVVERLFENIFPASLDVKDYYAYAERGMLNGKVK